MIVPPLSSLISSFLSQAVKLIIKSRQIEKITIFFICFINLLICESANYLKRLLRCFSMGKEEVNRIKKLFSEIGIKPLYLEHEPVITSEDAARTRGFELRQGIKAILFTDGKNNWVIVDIPADRKGDQ